MDLKQLERFVVAAEEGTIGGASERLGLSQPAFTRSINMLEADVGAALFERLPRGVRLTEIGLALLPQAKLVLRDRARLVETVKTFKGLSGGSVALGVTPNLAETLGLEVVLEFARKHPKISVTVEIRAAADLMQMLQEGLIDLGLATVGSETVPSSLLLEPLFEQLLSIVVGKDHPLAIRGSAPFEVLSEQQWIITNSTIAREGLHRTFTSRGVRPPFFNILCESLNLQKKLLLSGQYVTILDQEVVREELANGTIKVLTVETEGIYLQSGLLLRRDDAVKPAASALSKLIRLASRSRTC